MEREKNHGFRQIGGQQAKLAECQETRKLNLNSFGRKKKHQKWNRTFDSNNENISDELKKNERKRKRKNSKEQMVRA